jgi:hypothetical protein
MVDVFKEVNLPRRYIAIHARYGDKAKESPPQRMENYFMSACTLSKVTGISDVFLASDSLKFIQDFSKTKSVGKGYQGWRCEANLRIYYNAKCYRPMEYRQAR